jgi:hypothetical protein
VNASPGSAPWFVAVASVTGADHEAAGAPCQDAYSLDRSRPSLLVGAIADGAGSASQGGAGAQLAAERAVTAAVARLEAVSDRPDDWWRELVAGAMGQARAALDETAARAKQPVRDFATTLLLFIATPDLVAVGQVGDGAVVVQDATGELPACTWPKKGEYVNETVFLTSEDWRPNLQSLVHRGRIAGVAAFSDGLERLCLNLEDGTPHSPFFGTFFRRVRATADPAEAQAMLEALLRSPRVRERTGDDLTLLAGTLPR